MLIYLLYIPPSGEDLRVRCSPAEVLAGGFYTISPCNKALLHVWPFGLARYSLPSRLVVGRSRGSAGIPTLGVASGSACAVGRRGPPDSGPLTTTTTPQRPVGQQSKLSAIFQFDRFESLFVLLLISRNQQPAPQWPADQTSITAYIQDLVENFFSPVRQSLLQAFS